jgi:hypothetical protein
MLGLQHCAWNVEVFAFFESVIQPLLHMLSGQDLLEGINQLLFLQFKTSYEFIRSIIIFNTNVSGLIFNNFPLLYHWRTLLVRMDIVADNLQNFM